MREAGTLCAEEELCLEADGIWFSRPGPPEGVPGRAEVKAVVAYAGK